MARAPAHPRAFATTAKAFSHSAATAAPIVYLKCGLFSGVLMPVSVFGVGLGAGSLSGLRDTRCKPPAPLRRPFNEGEA